MIEMTYEQAASNKNIAETLLPRLDALIKEAKQKGYTDLHGKLHWMHGYLTGLKKDSEANLKRLGLGKAQ